MLIKASSYGYLCTTDITCEFSYYVHMDGWMDG